ncbi:hypothetical protein PMAYCL1PPCAC_28681, partial [Pristionchus mayeri]
NVYRREQRKENNASEIIQFFGMRDIYEAPITSGTRVGYLQGNRSLCCNLEKTKDLPSSSHFTGELLCSISVDALETVYLPAKEKGCIEK